MKIVRKIREWVMQCCIRFSPKFNYLYIKAYPDFEDGVVAVYDQLKAANLSKVVWCCATLDRTALPIEGSNVVFVKKGSFRDVYYACVSKLVIMTHGHFVSKVPSNQICVNLWHGMPYKTIGAYCNSQFSRADTYLCSTSPLFQKIMAKAFGMPLERTLTTGMPRNDRLRSMTAEDVWSKSGIDRSKYDKVFFWLPTYRQSVVGYIGQDGTEVGNVFNMDGFPTDDFCKYLELNRCLCIIKPHPMAPKKKIESSSHLMIIDEDWLWSRGLTLYPLVGVVDFLVSDISSIMIDYLLLNKPIVVCFEDVEEYQGSRSFVFDPIEEWLPGTIVKNYPDLLNALSRCVNGEDEFYEKRAMLTKAFHQHCDFSSSQRLVDVINGNSG